MNQKTRQKREREQQYYYPRHDTSYVCRACHDTMACPTCGNQVTYINGEKIPGCSDCNYTGICPKCTARIGG